MSMSDRPISRRHLLKLSSAGMALTAGCITDVTGGPDTQVPQEHRPSSFLERDGTQLTLDGDPVYLFGTRPGYVINLNETKPDVQRTLFGDRVDQMLNQVVQMGGTLARVHAFQPFWGDETLQPEPGQYNETVMKQLDRIIEAARIRGLRLSLMLINSKPAIHNADSIADKHGVNAHTYAYYADSAEEYDDFFTNSECKELYKQRVEAILTRENTITGVEYRNEPAIAMWELGNEIEWEEPWEHEDPTLRPWIEEMSSYVKSIDDNHLVTTGEFGWANRNNFVADHDPDGIDLCSIHYYPGPNGGYNLPDDPDKNHPELLEELIAVGQEQIGKPVYLGEYNWKVQEGADPPHPTRNEELRIIHESINQMDVSAAAFHALGLGSIENYPRAGATVYADDDEGSMTEFRRAAEQYHKKSADGTLSTSSL